MKYFNKIDAYFQGRLSSEEEDLLWEEMEDNKELQNEYDTYATAIELFEELGEPTPEIIEQIKEEFASKDNPIERPQILEQKRSPYFNLLAFLISGLFILLFAFWVQSNNQTEIEPPKNNKEPESPPLDSPQIVLDIKEIRDINGDGNPDIVLDSNNIDLVKQKNASNIDRNSHGNIIDTNIIEFVEQLGDSKSDDIIGKIPETIIDSNTNEFVEQIIDKQNNDILINESIIEFASKVYPKIKTISLFKNEKPHNGKTWTEAKVSFFLTDRFQHKQEILNQKFVCRIVVPFENIVLAEYEFINSGQIFQLSFSNQKTISNRKNNYLIDLELQISLIKNGREFPLENGDRYFFITDEPKFNIFVSTDTIFLDNDKGYLKRETELINHQYGNLYTWETAKKACPKIFSVEEWENAIITNGGINEPKKYDDDLTFRNLLDKNYQIKFGGIANKNKKIQDVGSEGYYWSGSEKNKKTAWAYSFRNNNGMIRIEKKAVNKNKYCSCLKLYEGLHTSLYSKEEELFFTK